jgi:hypothetical protein
VFVWSSFCKSNVVGDRRKKTFTQKRKDPSLFAELIFRNGEPVHKDFVTVNQFIKTIV